MAGVGREGLGRRNEGLRGKTLSFVSDQVGEGREG